MINVKVWGENIVEHKNEFAKSIYPHGIHQAIAGFLNLSQGILATTATLQEPEHGLSEEVLQETDVLTWWGHCAHGQVEDVIVDRIQKRVLEGMGLIVLHSGHYSKIFKRLLGTSCSLAWREAGERERLWVCQPGHPIVQGLGSYVELEQSEMYGEPFAIPTPEEQILISWFEGGEVFRSGVTYRRGKGKIFYFSPGHETYPIYHHKAIQQILSNAVRWAKMDGAKWVDSCPHTLVEHAREPILAKGPRLHLPNSKGIS